MITLKISRKYSIIGALFLEVFVVDDGFTYHNPKLVPLEATYTLKYQGKVTTFPWPLFKFEATRRLERNHEGEAQVFIENRTVLLGENQIEYLVEKDE